MCHKDVHTPTLVPLCSRNWNLQFAHILKHAKLVHASGALPSLLSSGIFFLQCSPFTQVSHQMSSPQRGLPWSFHPFTLPWFLTLLFSASWCPPLLYTVSYSWDAHYIFKVDVQIRNAGAGDVILDSLETKGT